MPKSKSKLALRGALALLSMRWRVWEAKLMLYLAIGEQEEGGADQVGLAWHGDGSQENLFRDWIT